MIAGSVRGRRLVVPPGTDVRPTQDRVREAMFSALDARGAIADASVLDLYAGTGALAIEALSRGAARAVLVERSRDAIAAIDTNLEACGFRDRARVEPRAVEAFLATPARDAPFDLVLCDPPYDFPAADLSDVLASIASTHWLAPDAMVVVERAQRASVEPPPGLRVMWERAFGDTLVTFLAP
ncbi:MAG: putative methyltransferase (methylase) [Actinomycetia bacterium]|nr:putative methyltransferase (methylase) [Actinomycetes bacterium]